MSEISKVDLKWLLMFVENYEFLLDSYPELFKESDVEDMKIVKQILEEKINE